LKEEVTFNPDGITSRDWRSYPIFRFSDVPVVETVLINRPGQPYLGVGEGAQGPVAAAIANAVFDAIGIRVRTLPITPDKILKELK
jgi:CO/xanthine dehydrogenase Mo-binding subunit